MLPSKCLIEPVQEIFSRKHVLSLSQAQGKLREKSFLDPSHSLGMTALPVTWRALRSFDVTQDMLCASHLFSDWLHIQSQLSPTDEPPAL